MEEGVEVNITGLKCDNPSCDYQEDGVDFENYASHIGRPCPKCGWSLLTQEDYDACVRVKRAASALNAVVGITKWMRPSHYANLLFGRKDPQ